MLAAIIGTIYLAMPLTIIGARFYDIYEEYTKFTWLKTAKAKFQQVINAVITINSNKGGLRGVTATAAETRSADDLRREIQRWNDQGKSQELPMYAHTHARTHARTNERTIACDREVSSTNTHAGQ